MIKSFKHKGLKALYEKGQSKGVRQDHVVRLRMSLDDIEAANWGLHELSGDLAGQHAIKVNGNWRLFFEFKDGHVYVLDYDDYH